MYAVDNYEKGVMKNSKADEKYRYIKTYINNEPVSYTHLRAHETVLDLVCRLLLEKKNKH